jgi:predicted RNA-binding Zn-ribbon protein involved in translation (DUF1610 family)
MSAEKRRLNQENFVDTSLLLDAITSLIDGFKQAGFNPPISIRVDKWAFDKLLEEASKLYSSINVKDSIENQEFSIANIINIVLESGEEKADNRNKHSCLHKQNDTPQIMKSKREFQRKQQSHRLSTTTTKYECPNCGVIFDTPAGHRKHHQAFHGKVEEPKVIERAEI